MDSSKLCVKRQLAQVTACTTLRRLALLAVQTRGGADRHAQCLSLVQRLPRAMEVAVQAMKHHERSDEAPVDMEKVEVCCCCCFFFFEKCVGGQKWQNTIRKDQNKSVDCIVFYFLCWRLCMVDGRNSKHNDLGNVVQTLPIMVINYPQIISISWIPGMTTECITFRPAKVQRASVLAFQASDDRKMRRGQKNVVIFGAYTLLSTNIAI